MVVNLPFELMRLSSAELNEQRKETVDLIKKLNELSRGKQKRGSVKKIVNFIAGTDIEIDSWRFNEWDYSNNKVKLPTYARGLFTTNYDKIICRGYDKFFNVDEFFSVMGDQLAKTTVGPYCLTIKSNGCIVFISGLKDGTLVVCSKHSTGYKNDMENDSTKKNHALASQIALEKQLNGIGLSKKDLALTLYSYGLTAVCEYCDDEFEEHVLEYKDNRAGLYLHGLNFNIPKFKTYPMNFVKQFGEVFGFNETHYITFPTYEESINFMENLGKTSVLGDEELEGFVVRCFKKSNHDDFFFKYKFEEPYLLYRELREVTKQFISNGYENVHYGKHKLICMDYLKFIMPILHDNENLKQRYLNNKGILELRKKYIESKNTTGMQIINEEVSMKTLEDEMRKLEFGDNQTNRYVLITVATIGCGKTTTSLSLNNLYPHLVGHVQNDNIHKPVKDKLVGSGLEILINKPIVILDKNNHKTVERKQIFDDFQKLNKVIPESKLKFICLNFLQNTPKNDEKLWDITKNRVVNRGDNHQSIKVIGDGVDNAEKIMKGFISRFQPVNVLKQPDSNFDHVINLEVDEPDSSLHNLKTIVEDLKNYAKDLDLKEPTEEEYIKAFQEASNYKPSITKIIRPNSKKQYKPSYFGLSITERNDFLKKVEVLDSPFYETLKKHDRIQSSFHITLIHSKSKKNHAKNKEIWANYTQTLFHDDLKQIEACDDFLTQIQGHSVILPSDYKCDICLKKLLWNDKVMCVSVEILSVYNEEGSIELELGNKHPHITVGTINENVRAIESNSLLNEFYDFPDQTTIRMVEFEEKCVLQGLLLFASY